MDAANDADLTDRALVAAFLTSRREAVFRLLYRRHGPRMYRVGRQLLGGAGALSEDAVQEAWLRAIRALHTFEWRSSLASWLTGFVINVAREFRAKARRPLAEPPPAPTRTDTHELALTQALEQMAEGARMVLILHDVGGFTHAEIAALLGIAEGASKSRLSRARRQMRTLLEGQS